jgi:hypothetical protein
MITPNFGADPTTAASREVPDPITELLRVHARDLIAAALEAEVQSVLQQLRADGADVVRNGYLPERRVTTAVGDVAVEVPRIRSRDGEPVSFASSMIPKYLRRSSSISAWAAYAYLKGISEGDVARCYSQPRREDSMRPSSRPVMVRWDSGPSKRFTPRRNLIIRGPLPGRTHSPEGAVTISAMPRAARVREPSSNQRWGSSRFRSSRGRIRCSRVRQHLRHAPGTRARRHEGIFSRFHSRCSL